jgi:hypothetical protein
MGHRQSNLVTPWNRDDRGAAYLRMASATSFPPPPAPETAPPPGFLSSAAPPAPATASFLSSAAISPPGPAAAGSSPEAAGGLGRPSCCWGEGAAGPAGDWGWTEAIAACRVALGFANLQVLASQTLFFLQRGRRRRRRRDEREREHQPAGFQPTAHEKETGLASSYANW